MGDQRLTLGETSAADIQHDLLTSLQNGDAVTASVGPNWPVLMRNPGPLVDSHVYSVLKYDTETDTVTVRNPWGNAAQTALATPGTTVDGITSGNDGTLSMPFATFQSHFNSINLANHNDAATHAGHLALAQVRLSTGEPDLASQVNDVASEINEGAYLATSTAWNLLDSSVQASARAYGWTST